MIFANLSGGRDSTAMVVRYLEIAEALLAKAIMNAQIYGAINGQL